MNDRTRAEPSNAILDRILADNSDRLTDQIERLIKMGSSLLGIIEEQRTEASGMCDHIRALEAELADTRKCVPEMPLDHDFWKAQHDAVLSRNGELKKINNNLMVDRDKWRERCKIWEAKDLKERAAAGIGLVYKGNASVTGQVVPDQGRNQVGNDLSKFTT